MELSSAVTEREKQLVSSQMFELLPFATSVLWGPDFVVRSANKKQLAAWKKTPEECIGKPFPDLVTGMRKEELKAILTQVYRTGESYKGFLPFQNESGPGENIEISCEPILTDTESTEGILFFTYGTKGSEPLNSDALDTTDPLSDTESFSRSILESSPDCLKVLDASGRLHYMNENGLCLMEIDDFCIMENKAWWELWPEESRDLVKASVEHALSGKVEQFQAFCPTAKGTPKWWDVRVSPLTGAGGTVEQLIAVSRDITHSKENEAALVTRNRQLDLVAHTAQRIIMHNNGEVDLLQRVFDAVCEALGLETFFNFQSNNEKSTLHLQTYRGLSQEEKEKFATMSFGQHLCGQVAEKKKLIVVENVATANYPGSEAIQEAGMKAYAGFPLLAGGKLIGTVSFTTRKRSCFIEGEIQTIQTVCDQLAVTIERQRLTRELQESDLRFRTIFNHQFQFSGLLTPDGKIIDISDSAIRQSGLSKEELQGMKLVEAPWYQDIPEARSAWLEQFEEALQSTVAATPRETPYRVYNGAIRYALNTASAIRNSEDEVQFLLIESIDITDRKWAELALKNSESRFRRIFQSSPVSKWIEDYTETRRLILELKASGITDFETYLCSRPDIVTRLIESITIKDVNETATYLYQDTKEELMQGIAEFFVSDTVAAFIQQVKIIANGGGRYETETVIRTRTGILKNVLVRVDFPTGDDYSNLIVALLDITERKELEKKLELQYEELETIYRNAPIGLGMIDKDFRFVRINERLAEINGISAAEHEGRRIEEIVPDLAEQAKKIFRQVFETGKPVLDFEIKGETYAQPGVTRVWKESWHPVKNESGETFAISIVVEEITERKKAEEALRQSEEQMRLVLDASNTGIWVVDLEKVEIYWSPQHYAIFGITEFDGQIESFRKMVHPEDLDRVWAAFSAAIENGGKYRSEFRIIRPSGELRWVGNYGHCEYDAVGKPLRFLGMAQDITERKEAEQALLESEARFRTLAEALPQMVWTTDAEGRVLFASKFWKEYSGIDNVSEAWTYMVHPEDMPQVMEQWHTHFSQQIPMRQQVRLRNKDGEYRWHHAIAEPLIDSEGVMLKWVGTLTDIHAQKTIAEKLEELIAERTKELQRSNDDLQQFAHVSSHDLKEPVRKVLTFVSRMDTEFGEELPAGAKTYLSKINTAARRSYEMIEGALRYSMLSSTQTQGGPVDLNARLQEILVDLEVLISEKNAKFNFNTLPVIEGYSHLLHQLFYNLIGNALKFSKPALPPRIDIDWREAGEYELHRLGLPVDRRFICISVMDNGIGFNQQYAQRIFHTFARLHTKDKFEGAGLGLALCKKIAERHGGAIEAEGLEGEGASFHIYLPFTLS